MKRATVVMLVAMAACGEGPRGIQGLRGAQGPPGKDGRDGSLLTAKSTCRGWAFEATLHQDVAFFSDGTILTSCEVIRDSGERHSGLAFYAEGEAVGVGCNVDMDIGQTDDGGYFAFNNTGDLSFTWVDYHDTKEPTLDGQHATVTCIHGAP